jgi:hypothetical protein
MTRFVSATNEAEFARDSLAPLLLVDLDFASGMVRAHTGQSDIVWNGNTYTGVAGFGGVDEVTEEAGVSTKPLRLRLAGIPNELISSAMLETYQGRPVVLYMAAVNVETGTFVDTPETLWSGIMDVMTVELGPETSVITLDCEDPDYAQPLPRRYTQADHQRRFTGDRFFEFLPRIPQFRGQWGTKGFGSGWIDPPPPPPFTLPPNLYIP